MVDYIVSGFDDVLRGKTSATSAKAASVPQQTPIDNENWRTAFHESGHAIAAVLRKVPFSTVTVEPTSKALGMLNWNTMGCDGFDLAVVCYAGQFAEALLGPLTRDTWTQDRELVAKHLPDTGRQNQAFAHAEWLVNRHEVAIERVAKVLMRMGTISQDRVRREMNIAGIIE